MLAVGILVGTGNNTPRGVSALCACSIEPYVPAARHLSALRFRFASFAESTASAASTLSVSSAPLRVVGRFASVNGSSGSESAKAATAALAAASAAAPSSIAPSAESVTEPSTEPSAGPFAEPSVYSPSCRLLDDLPTRTAPLVRRISDGTFSSVVTSETVAAVSSSAAIFAAALAASSAARCASSRSASTLWRSLWRKSSAVPQREPAQPHP